MSNLNINNPNSKNVGKSTKKDFEGMYFIRDIENLTGIKAYTLRVWEQRYNILETKRTDTNIRYYDDDDLRFLISVGILNSNGIKISKIAQMSTDEVQKYARIYSESQIKNDGVMQSLGEATLRFDETEFFRVLNGYILRSGMETTMFDIIFPYLRHLGLLWLDGTISISHEHFVTNLLKQRLFVAINDLPNKVKPNGKKYVLFVPSGETHRLSVIFAEFMLRSRGQKVFSLGEGTPLEELHTIVKEVKPDAIFCSITSSNFSVPPQTYVKTLKNNWPKLHILLTGNYIIGKKIDLPDKFHIVANQEDCDRSVKIIEGVA
jgi:MerR family transcriptional regulator, light-induced transcriptional regulator